MKYTDYEEYEEYFLLFSRLFEEGFNRPELKTKKFITLWYDVDVLDLLAGPFYSIDTRYNCDYVFEGTHEYFKEIKSCEDFLNWCLKIIKLYISKIEELDCVNHSEEDDKRTMLLQASVFERLTYMAYDIQKDRWKFIKKPY